MSEEGEELKYPYFRHYDGTVGFLQDMALAELVRSNFFYVQTCKLDMSDEDDQELLDRGNRGLCLELNINDLLYWGCADSLQIAAEDIRPIYEAWKSCKKYAVDRWACIRLKEQPQAPIVKRMKEAGVWDEVMEELPMNGWRNR